MYRYWFSDSPLSILVLQWLVGLDFCSCSSHMYFLNYDIFTVDVGGIRLTIYNDGFIHPSVPPNTGSNTSRYDGEDNDWTHNYGKVNPPVVPNIPIIVITVTGIDRTEPIDITAVVVTIPHVATAHWFVNYNYYIQLIPDAISYNLIISSFICCKMDLCDSF